MILPTFLAVGISIGGLTGFYSGSLQDVFTVVANVLIFVVGAISIIMIIIGGLKYVLSSGDPSKVNSAKNTILYSLVGVSLAILSYAMVNYVIGQFGIK